MLVCSDVKGKKKMLLRGPVTKEPYKGWIELQSANTGQTRASGGAAAGLEGSKSLSLEVSISTQFVDFSVFAISPAAGIFDVQIDFVGRDGKDIFSMVMFEVLISSLVTGGTASDGPPSIGVLLNARKIEYTYRGSARPGSPSWSIKGP